MGTMTNSNLDAYVREYFDNMEAYTNKNKMMILKRFQKNIKQYCTSESLIPFLENMKNVEYIIRTWAEENMVWIKKNNILLTDDMVQDLASYASIFLDMFTLKALYAYFPKDSTVYWQKIGGHTVGRPVYGYKTTFQCYSAVPYSEEYPFSIVTHTIADAMGLEVEGHFIALRGDDITTDLWRLAEMLYGDETALKYKQM